MVKTMALFVCLEYSNFAAIIEKVPARMSRYFLCNWITAATNRVSLMVYRLPPAYQSRFVSGDSPH